MGATGAREGASRLALQVVAEVLGARAALVARHLNTLGGCTLGLEVPIFGVMSQLMYVEVPSLYLEYLLSCDNTESQFNWGWFASLENVPCHLSHISYHLPPATRHLSPQVWGAWPRWRGGAGWAWPPPGPAWPCWCTTSWSPPPPPGEHLEVLVLVEVTNTSLPPGGRGCWSTPSGWSGCWPSSTSPPSSP